MQLQCNFSAVPVQFLMVAVSDAYRSNNGVDETAVLWQLHRIFRAVSEQFQGSGR